MHLCSSVNCVVVFKGIRRWLRQATSLLTHRIKNRFSPVPLKLYFFHNMAQAETIRKILYVLPFDTFTPSNLLVYVQVIISECTCSGEIDRPTAYPVKRLCVTSLLEGLTSTCQIPRTCSLSSHQLRPHVPRSVLGYIYADLLHWLYNKINTYGERLL